MSEEINRTLALAGLLQSCTQVRKLARQGEWNDADAATCIYSLFQIDADSVEEVYEDVHGLEAGLMHLKNLLQRNIERADMEITRYALTLLHLERKLIEQKPLLDKIRQGLYAIKNEYDIHDSSNTTLQSRIADVYIETISTIPPKVQVEGEREYLSQMNNSWRVRTMLLCGIRSAVLWRQLGGTRWGLFFGRRRILRSIEQIIEL